MKAIHLAFPVSDFYGYGICGKYLLKEFAGRMPTYYYNPGGESVTDDTTKAIMSLLDRPILGDIPLLQVSGNDFAPIVPRGNPNAVYIFSEWEITEKQKDNLKLYDVLIAGSEWNAKVIRNAGFKCAAVPQGVDLSVFRPMKRIHNDHRFVIFSGGKWEHRKAQDLVVRAVKVLQERHKDIV